MKKVICLFFAIVVTTAVFAYGSDDTGNVSSLGEFVVDKVIDLRDGKRYILSNKDATITLTCYDHQYRYIYVHEGYTKAQLYVYSGKSKGVFFAIKIGNYSDFVVGTEFQFTKKTGDYY